MPDQDLESALVLVRAHGFQRLELLDEPGIASCHVIHEVFPALERSLDDPSFTPGRQYRTIQWLQAMALDKRPQGYPSPLLHVSQQHQFFMLVWF